MPTLSAPAKINLSLKVTSRREDGYHLLDSVMVKLDLADEIVFDITPQPPSYVKRGAKGGDTITCNDPHVPCDQTNTLWKVADLMRRESGKDFGIKIHLTKKIPVAAGLGGGSSDAAALLKGLNRELGLNWTTERMIDVGVRVGADVPFFLAEGPQRVTGIGEVLEPVTVTPLSVILVNPGIPVSTAEAYRWYDDGSGAGGSGRAPGRADGLEHGWAEPEPGSAPSTKNPLRLTVPTVDDIAALLENDLERVVIPRYPVLARIKESLVKAGALGALMSGSGPTVFGLFESTAARDRGYEILLRKRDPQWWIWKGASL